MNVLPDFDGVALNDFWKQYCKHGCKHSLCKVGLEENPPPMDVDTKTKKRGRKKQTKVKTFGTTQVCNPMDNLKYGITVF